MGKLEWWIALRYLRARRREGFISIVAWFSLLGILLGVATLIVVLSVMNGFRAELLARVIGINGHVVVSSAFAPRINEPDILLENLQSRPDIISAAPLIQGQALASSAPASSARAASGALVRGMRAEDLQNRPLLLDSLRAGDQALTKFSQDKGIILGERLARRLGLFAGDRLKLIAPTADATVFGSLPRARTFRVIDTLELGMYEYDNSLVLMPMAAAQDFFDAGDAVDVIEVIGKDPEEANRLALILNRQLSGRANAVSWQQVNASFFTALQVERNVMFLILTLIILVAAFNIVSSQIMLVKEKASGVAILRSMGASQGLILRIFMVTGSAVGVIGAMLGLAVGLLLANNLELVRKLVESLANVDVFSPEIYFLSKLPSRIDSGEVLSVVAMAIGLSLLAAIYPAWRAARLDPVEILRYG